MSSGRAQGLEAVERLEVLDRLLHTLTGVLDVREVFDRVSDIARHVLPHDALSIAEVIDNGAKVRIHASHGLGPLPEPLDIVAPDPTMVTEPWDFRLIDDALELPSFSESPGRSAGMRSMLFVSIRLEDRLFGGLNFYSKEVGHYTKDDVLVARRITDHVALAISHRRLAEASRRAAALRERAASLDLLDGLMNAIEGVLDIRDVLDRVFEISQQAMPHDAMTIGEINEDGTRIRLFATTGALSHLPVGLDVPINNPELFEGDWEYQVIDDMPNDRRTSHSLPVKAGMRSSILIPVRIGQQLRGSVTFQSEVAHRFTADDVRVARRIAAHITLLLSHQRLAEQVRRNEELRARTTNLELLDELLASLIDSGELPDVFGRISAIAKKVLLHDAAVLMVRLPDGLHARVYAKSGPPITLPQITEVPKELLDNPGWEYDIFDDLSLQPARYASLVGMGLQSLVRVPIRLDGQFAGALVFFSTALSAFKQSDVLVVRRIADRLTLTLVHDREITASRRADEASERASKLEARVRALTEELDSRTGYRRVVGESRQWRQVLTQATQVASTETTVLLLGESGTGKEVVARFVHRASARAHGPFIALNCAALPEQLLEAELFGYERGAYTGATQSKPGQLEQAGGGTLFLDEVGEMSLAAQTKFLRVLQEREFQRLGGTRVLRTDARIVAATNRDLPRAIAQGQFREDLYYRLNVFAIHLPPLRERRDDILPLSEAFLAEICRGIGYPPAGISRDARALLNEYHWPGNVRELRNILERAAILCEGGLITADYLALSTAPAPTVRPVTEPPLVPAAKDRPSSAGDLHSMEREMIVQALQTMRFNKSKAAKSLGLTRQQLYVRMRKYGLE